MMRGLERRRCCDPAPTRPKTPRTRAARRPAPDCRVKWCRPKLEGRCPHSGTESDEAHRTEQTCERSTYCSPGRQIRPRDRQEDDRKVGARCDCKHQSDHECDILVLEHDAETHREKADRNDGSLRHKHFLVLARTASADHSGVEIVAGSGCTSERQAGYDG